MTRKVCHLYGIEFTVEFRQEYTFMDSLLDNSFEHGYLICEILLKTAASLC